MVQANNFVEQSTSVVLRCVCVDVGKQSRVARVGHRIGFRDGLQVLWAILLEVVYSAIISLFEIHGLSSFLGLFDVLGHAFKLRSEFIDQVPVFILNARRHFFRLVELVAVTLLKSPQVVHQLVDLLSAKVLFLPVNVEESGHAFIFLFPVGPCFQLQAFFLFVVEFSSNSRLQMQQFRLCKFFPFRKFLESLLDVSLSVLTVLQQHLTEFIVSFLNVRVNVLIVLCFQVLAEFAVLRHVVVAVEWIVQEVINLLLKAKF